MLSYQEIKKLINSKHSNERADIFAGKVREEIFYIGEDMYISDDSMICKPVCGYDSRKNKLINKISLLIENSFNAMNEEQKDNLIRDKEYLYLIRNSTINSIAPQLIHSLERNDIKLNDYKSQIHFRNGYIDIETKQFMKRKAGQYVTSVIDRDYKKSSKDSQLKVDKIISKIFPCSKDRKIILTILGSAFSGNCSKDRHTLFLLGKTSAGKSLLMQLLRCGFSETYVKELTSEVFVKNNKNIDKIMNQYIKEPTIRISWVNELSDKSTDLSLFKKFCEGVIQTCRLYKDGFETVKHDSLLACTLNTMPNIRIDTATSNRMLPYDCKSEFTNDVNRIDESKNIYLRDDTLKSKFEESEELQNAIVDYFLSYCRKWMKKGVPELTKSFMDSKNDIISANDSIQDFLDKCIEITGDLNDRISKIDMRDEYLNMYPHKNISVQQLLGSLKDKSITYKSKFRCENVQGCYVGVKLKRHGECKEKYTDKRVQELKEVIKEQELRIKELENEINKLKKIKKQKNAKDKKKSEPESESELESEPEKESKQKSYKEKENIEIIKKRIIPLPEKIAPKSERKTKEMRMLTSKEKKKLDGINSILGRINF